MVAAGCTEGWARLHGRELGWGGGGVGWGARLTTRTEALVVGLPGATGGAGTNSWHSTPQHALAPCFGTAPGRLQQPHRRCPTFCGILQERGQPPGIRHQEAAAWRQQHSVPSGTGKLLPGPAANADQAVEEVARLYGPWVLLHILEAVKASVQLRWLIRLHLLAGAALRPWAGSFSCGCCRFCISPSRCRGWWLRDIPQLRPDSVASLVQRHIIHVRLRTALGCAAASMAGAICARQLFSNFRPMLLLRA